MENDLKKISFSKAIRKWLEIIDGQGFDWGSEPFQSLEKLRCWRNKTIYFEAKHPSIPDSDLHLLGESAYYTAIESSRAILISLTGISARLGIQVKMQSLLEIIHLKQKYFSNLCSPNMT